MTSLPFMIIKQSKNGKFPLVLLHGWGLNSAVWQAVFDALSEHFDVHCVDLPGFGQNQKQPLTQYDLGSMVQTIKPLIPTASLLVGWSLGGLVASRLAIDHPDKVAALCWLASTPCFAERDNWKGIKPQILQDFTQSLLKDSDKTITRFLALQALGSVSARQDIKVLKNAVLEQPKADIKALADGLTILKNVDMRAQLQSLQLPIRGIYGRLDPLVAVQSIAQLAPELVDFQYQVLDKASHAPFISHRQQFIAEFNRMHQFLL